MDLLPASRCLVAALATPLAPDLAPDEGRLVHRARGLLAAGCDGIALFGTTGEGPEFAVADRTATLEAMLAAGLPAGRLIVSAGALAIPDVAELATHATVRGVHGVLLMPPCVYRGGITEDATFRYFAAVIERVARPDLRLYLYHFPEICGVPITPTVIRRLDERYPGTVAGVKDSGGELGFTEELMRRFSHLSVFTGSEMHLPELVALGARGTVCGLANAMPRLMRAMLDAPTAFDRREILKRLIEGDAILGRWPFIPSVKAVLADLLGDPAWRRCIPPLPEPPMAEVRRLVADFRDWDARLPPAWQNAAAFTGDAPEAGRKAARQP
ncbi:MAG: dihydrodipicolinate synthase family protein [Amaricoccus sp.]